MKEHVQDYGVRKWAGDDLIELQSEPLSALQALVAPYAPCILTGCELETVPDGNGDGSPAYRLHAGYVALKGRKTVENGAGTETENGETATEEYVKIVRVTAQTVKQPTVFLTLGCTPLSRAYGNGENKAIAYDYTAEVCDVLSEVGDRPYLELVADADNPRLPDKLGITRKLDRVGGVATDTVVTFTETGNQDEPEDLKSGLTLGLLISRIKKWLGKKVDKENGYGLSQANFTPTEKLKLLGIASGANKYVHPELNHIPSGGNGGDFLRWSALGTAKWEAGDYASNTDSRLTDSRTPKGSAGGDLSGSYPNPTIRSSVNLSGNPTVSGNLTINGTGESLIKGNLRLRGNGNYGNKLNFGDGDYVCLHEASDDNLTIKAKNIDIAAYSVMAPTPATADNSTQVATTAYVKNNLTDYLKCVARASYSGGASGTCNNLKGDCILSRTDTGKYKLTVNHSISSGIPVVNMNYRLSLPYNVAVTSQSVTSINGTDFFVEILNGSNQNVDCPFEISILA